MKLGQANEASEPIFMIFVYQSRVKNVAPGAPNLPLFLHPYNGAWSASPTGVLSVPSRPYVKSGLEVATDDVAKAGASCRRTSRFGRSVVETPAKSTSKRGCRHCRGVPTSDHRSFHGPSHQKAACSRTGVCHVQHCRRDTARIAVSDDATLLRRHREEVKGPLLSDAVKAPVGDALWTPCPYRSRQPVALDEQALAYFVQRDNWRLPSLVQLINFTFGCPKGYLSRLQLGNGRSLCGRGYLCGPCSPTSFPRHSIDFQLGVDAYDVHVEQKL